MSSTEGGLAPATRRMRRSPSSAATIDTTHPDAVECGFDLEGAEGTRVSAHADAGRGCPELGPVSFLP
ncbi:MAG: hypothetical protein K0R81_2913 [Microbacterium sp.]|nr:hypothetical protein [Microbacterium sp.]